MWGRVVSIRCGAAYFYTHLRRHIYIYIYIYDPVEAGSSRPSISLILSVNLGIKIGHVPLPSPALLLPHQQQLLLLSASRGTPLAHFRSLNQSSYSSFLILCVI